MKNKSPQYKRKGKTRAEILSENPDAFKKKSLKDPYYLKVGKFKRKNVYDAKIDMGDQMKNLFLDLGRQVITEDQYINIGFNYSLAKGLDNLEKSNKSKRK